MTNLTSTVRHHLVTARVENKAGVLLRVAGLFSRRGYNIISLAVAPTDDENFSRISIVVDVEHLLLQQVIDQLDKLVNVVDITELDPHRANKAELLLANVDVSPDRLAEFELLADQVGASIIDRSEGSVTVQLAADPDVLDEFERKLRSYGISELQRTGTVALPKLSTIERDRSQVRAN